MPVLECQFLKSDSFTWKEKVNPDGSKREAGSMTKMFVYETAPSPSLSSVLEVQIPSDQIPEFDKRHLSWKRLESLKIYVEFLGKKTTDQIGRAKFLGFAQ